MSILPPLMRFRSERQECEICLSIIELGHKFFAHDSERGCGASFHQRCLDVWFQAQRQKAGTNSDGEAGNSTKCPQCELVMSSKEVEKLVIDDANQTQGRNGTSEVRPLKSAWAAHGKRLSIAQGQLRSKNRLGN